MDDFEMDVAPLRAEETDSTATSGGGELGHADSRRIRERRRKLAPQVSAVAAILAVLLTGALLIGVSPGSRGTLGVMLFGTPTPTAALPFGAGIFYFEHGVSWSQSVPMIDGKPIGLDLTSGNLKYLRVARGRHTLTYAPEPFTPLRCVFTVPAAKGDTCPLGKQSDLGLPNTATLARVIDLSDSPRNLPADQLTALEAALQPYIDLPQQPVTVREGEQYLADDGTHVAEQPLSATLIYQLASDPTGGCAFPDSCTGECATLCFSPGEGLDVGWSMQAFVQTGWRYTSASGAAVASLSSIFAPEQSGPLPVELDVTWRGAWRVSIPNQNFSVASPPNPTCELTNYSPERIEGLGSGDTYYYTYGGASAPNPADGCLLQVGQVNTQAGGGLTNLLLLYRFGVLLTVDKMGHALLPNLPQADAYERALAQQIALTLPPS